MLQISKVDWNGSCISSFLCKLDKKGSFTMQWYLSVIDKQTKSFYGQVVTWADCAQCPNNDTNREWLDNFTTSFQADTRKTSPAWVSVLKSWMSDQAAPPEHHTTPLTQCSHSTLFLCCLLQLLSMGRTKKSKMKTLAADDIVSSYFNRLK